ncbi:hypothetical protein VNO80_06065 [Phaseolus coccineus]|uniref:MaoC-like domain-containing protein n=1 Tax=Phaseolus coccineus TaxID=3886 RepID=A0AAN9RNJ9_PHACN
MLIRSLHCSKLQCLSLRGFTSVTPQQVLAPRDVLRKARAFTEEDFLRYSKVSFDSNPLLIESAAAKDVGFQGPLVHGMLVASLFPHIISTHFFPVCIGDEIIGEVQATNLKENRNRYLAKFKTRCFKNGELVAIDGETVALLPTLTVKQEQHKES